MCLQKRKRVIQSEYTYTIILAVPQKNVPTKKKKNNKNTPKKFNPNLVGITALVGTGSHGAIQGGGKKEANSPASLQYQSKTTMHLTEALRVSLGE